MSICIKNKLKVKNKLKISFDYDGTLHVPIIVNLAKILVEAGNDVWILTARCDYDQNLDLKKLISEIGIENEKVLYTNGDLKYKIYSREKFDIHYDDSIEEIEEINSRGGNGILVDSRIPQLKDDMQYIDWKRKCQ